MLRNTKVQLAAVLAVGALLGYLAASGKPRLDPTAQASTTSAQASSQPLEVLASRPQRIQTVDRDLCEAAKASPAASAAPCCPVGKQGSLLARVGNESQASGQEEEKAISFVVLLPANAILEIDDYKTDTTGETRTFHTPPLPVGGHYKYTLKATADGKEVTREIHLADGVENRFDLRAQFRPAGQKPAGAKHVVALGGGGGAEKRHAAQHPVHHGRRHRLDATALLPPRLDGR
jgi:uncharacterized protein (TIGR03000 family)